MRLLIGIVAAALAVVSPAALAQDFPTKPVTLVIPYPPGGTVDSLARIIAPHMEKSLGQPVVIENRAGAAGMIAAEYVKNSAADGYTLYFATNGALLFAPVIMDRADAYDWKKDFVSVGNVAITPMVLTARKELGIKTVDELLAKAKAGDVLMASPSEGSQNKMAGDLLMQKSGVQWRIVNYKGNAPAIASLLSGETSFGFDQIPAILPHIKEGSVIPLAITSVQRIATLPDVPTLLESGNYGFTAVTFIGLVGPAGTPDGAVAKLNEAINATLNLDEVKKQFSDLGAVADPTTPAEFTALMADTDKTWRPIVMQIKAKK